MLLVLLCSLCLQIKSYAEPGAKEDSQTNGLDISLISEVNAITPDQSFTLGLRLQHHKGFHTYWKNPGNIGMATAIEWELPEGYSASEIQWPYPERSIMATHPCHAYKRDVTLLVTITPPPTPKLTTKSPVTLTAHTRWMCCAEDCYPGFKSFSLSLPINSTPIINKKHKTLFTQARQEIPQSSKSINTKLLSTANEQSIQLLLKLKNNDTPIYLYSLDGQLSSDQKQTFIQKNDGSYLLTIPRSQYSEKETTSLPSILQTTAGYFMIDPRY